MLGHSWRATLIGTGILWAVVSALSHPLASTRSTVKVLPIVHHPPHPNHRRGKAPGHTHSADRRQPDIAPAQAARSASHKYGGRVLNVRLERGPAGPYYRVKLLDDGRVRIVHIDAH